jgi:cell division topological specificity factor
MNDPPVISHLTFHNCKKLEVIRKYINVGQDAISVNFEQDENQETLEVNIVLPDIETKKTKKTKNT